MGYEIPDFAAIRQRMLRDAANLDPTAPQDGDSDLFVRSSVTASAVSGLYDFLAWQARQLLPDTADSEYLEQHCALRGITRKPATRATGTLTLTGRAGAVVPAGTQAKDLSGVQYRTTASVTLSGPDEDATAAAPCEAVNAGALPDADDAPVTLLAAPSGVQSTARLTLTGGSDAEEDSALLARLLDYMRNPPSGGTAADYRRWAREVPGVAEAQVYPLRQGPGTVDVVISGPDGIPGADVLDACRAHIDSLRPVTAQANVYAPEALPVDMTLALAVEEAATLVSLRPDVLAALTAEFDALRPGEPLILSRCAAAVSGLAGVADVIVRLPQANVRPTALQWCRPGELTLEAL
ncbi:baseplate J/gp47 family protein [uncultured Desulfovibrio sp.]|uniref:baseplate J/gp47 family protein n=1 Tax=uncultured Desulfovibrio sp. TaxID=167968 RepID=UPI002629EB0E|nr:baseplate J/gp47 family protein [uncultured Desulfovibrio sp.]